MIAMTNYISYFFLLSFLFELLKTWCIIVMGWCVLFPHLAFVDLLDYISIEVTMFRSKKGDQKALVCRKAESKRCKQTYYKEKAGRKR
jgi:hypothetical protein